MIFQKFDVETWQKNGGVGCWIFLPVISVCVHVIILVSIPIKALKSEILNTQPTVVCVCVLNGCFLKHKYCVSDAILKTCIT